MKFCYLKPSGICSMNTSCALVFLLMKLRHSSERPYSCDVNFLPDTHHTNTATHHYVSLNVSSGHMLQQMTYHTRQRTTDTTIVCPLKSYQAILLTKNLDTYYCVSVMSHQPTQFTKYVTTYTYITLLQML